MHILLYNVPNERLSWEVVQKCHKTLKTFDNNSNGILIFFTLHIINYKEAVVVGLNTLHVAKMWLTLKIVA